MRKDRLYVYLSKPDYSLILAAAKRARLSVSEWSRQALLTAAQADAVRDGLTEVQGVLDRTLQRHLRRVVGLVASALKEAAIGRKLAEQAVYLVGFPEQSQRATRRLGPQGILQRAEQYAQEQMRRASERVEWFDDSGGVVKAEPGRKESGGDNDDDFTAETEEHEGDGGAV